MVDDLSASLPSVKSFEIDWTLTWSRLEIPFNFIFFPHKKTPRLQKWARIVKMVVTFQPSGFDHRQRIVVHRSDILKCQHNDPTPYSHSISLFKLQPFLTFSHLKIIVFRAMERIEKLWWHFFLLLLIFLFDSAWICCFMLDTSLRQTPNAKRQTPNAKSNFYNKANPYQKNSS